MALSRIFTTEIAESVLATRKNTALRTSTLGTASGIDALRTSTLAKELSQRLIHQVSEGPDGAGKLSRHPFERGSMRRVKRRAAAGTFRPWCSLRDK